MTEQTESQLTPLPNFKGREGPYLLIVMDGVGLGNKGEGDAVFQAQPPNLNKWMSECKEKGLYAELRASGFAVGLPTDDSMGNSEIGHNTLGSGQITFQRAKLVDKALKEKTLFEGPIWKKIIPKVAENNKKLHLTGLLSDAYVHSHTDQVYGIIEGAIKEGVKIIRIHPLLDGRDVPPTSAPLYIKALEDKLAELNEKYGGDIDAKIASGGGRMHITMDRYGSDWGMVERGWNVHVHGKVPEANMIDGYPGYFTSALEAIQTARDMGNDGDQYLPAFVIVNNMEDKSPIGKIEEGDAVINYNFRGDRATEITRAFVEEDFSKFPLNGRPKMDYIGIMQYDGEANLPPQYLLDPPIIINMSAQYLCAMGIKSYAIAETHKYGHVTYFWNGNNSGYVCEDLEEWKEITSLPNKQTESHPEMKAHEVTDHLLEAISSDKFKYLRVNYANGDMVGHTGNIPSAIKAVQVVDECMKKVVDLVLEKNGVVLITADHGNCDEMLDGNGNKVTSHSLNNVPMIILDSGYNGEYKVGTDIKEPGLANVLATFINLMGYEAPSMYEKSLLKF